MASRPEHSRHHQLQVRLSGLWRSSLAASSEWIWSRDTRLILSSSMAGVYQEHFADAWQPPAFELRSFQPRTVKAYYQPCPFGQIKEWNSFDADTGKDSSREVREDSIPDFSNWKDHDSYQQVSQRLLKDLRAENTA